MLYTREKYSAYTLIGDNYKIDFIINVENDIAVDVNSMDMSKDGAIFIAKSLPTLPTDDTIIGSYRQYSKNKDSYGTCITTGFIDAHIVSCNGIDEQKAKAIIECYFGG